jgi:hypothetical protein
MSLADEVARLLNDVGEIGRALVNVPVKIAHGGGGDTWIKGTKAEIDAAIEADGLEPPQRGFATDLGQYYRLVSANGGYEWRPDDSILRGTKAELDGWITSRGLEPPQLGYATDLERHYHLKPYGASFRWEAWDFLE